MGIELLISELNTKIVAPFMVLALLIAGIILSFKTGFIQFRKFFFMLKYTFSGMFKKSDSKKEGISPFAAMTTALSGTIGTGNIAGVATAVAIGGAGAIFWIWVSAFLGMATKYSEIVLSMKYRKKEKNKGCMGGPMYYIERAMGGKKLASCFAVFCLLSSFGIGNMTQSNTAASAVRSFFSISEEQLKFGVIVVLIIIGFVIIGGISRISKITSALVPAMAVFYIGGCVLIIFMDRANLLMAIKTIFISAFDMKAAVGGVLGIGMIKAIKIGFTRGIFTNEAGIGSAPIAHSAAQNEVPALQGMWGIFEVFFDTIVMCTLTGLVIVLSGLYKSGNSQNLALKCFELYLGDFAAILIAVSIVFFAVSTIISWSYYGESCVKYLCNAPGAVLLYKLVYIAAVYVGAFVTADLVWGIADLFNGMMMVPNLIGVLLLCNEVKQETKRLPYSVKKEKRKPESHKIN